MGIAERVLMGLLLGGVGIGCAVVLWPFLTALLWAAILVYTTWPVHEWLRRRLRFGRIPAASAMLTLTFLVIVVPVVLAVPSGAGDAERLRHALLNWMAQGLPPAPPALQDLPVVGSSLADLWDRGVADLAGLGDAVRPYLGMAAQRGLGLLLGLANSVLLFLLALLVAFFFYLSGDHLADKLSALLMRIAGSRAPRLIEVTGATVRGVVYGILGTAIVQGILTAFGLWLTGVPRAMLLGVVAGGLSVLPIGAPVIWIPSAIWLLTTGHTGWGIFLFVYGIVAVSGADSVIRPYFISRGAQLPFLLTMLGVLGGALSFGLVGIFLGPVLLGVGFVLINEWGPAGEARK